MQFPGLDPRRKKLFASIEDKGAKLSSVFKDVLASLSVSFGAIRIGIARHGFILTNYNEIVNCKTFLKLHLENDGNTI